MLTIVKGRRLFSTTTLSILVRNRNQLKIINKNDGLLVTKVSTHNLLPYMDMSYEYLQSTHIKFVNNFPELDVFKNKLISNPALANGEDYEEFPLLKILHICLKLIEDGNESKQKWEQLQNRCNFLMRNTSISDNVTLLFISVHKFNIELQEKIIKLLEEDLKFMTQLEKQFLFYCICQLKYKLNNNPHQSRLNKLKENLSISIKKTKLNLTNLIQWIILISIAHISHPFVLKTNLSKVQLYSKYLLTTQQFLSLIKCIDYRTTLVNYSLKQELAYKGRELINLYKQTVPNYDMLINSNREKVRIKLLLSYYYPGQPDNMLTTQQILHSSLSPPQSLKYLHWLWNNDYMDQFPLKSLYESIELKSIESHQPDKTQSFQHVDLVYYICWIEIGLGIYINYDKVIQLSEGWQYVPRGLEWPLWNYLAEIVKQKVSLSSQQKQSVTIIIQKIKEIQETRNKNKLIQQEIQNAKNKVENIEMMKFLNSMKLWTFKYCEPVGVVDFMSSFVSHDLRVVLNCLNKSQLVASSNQINNQHVQSKKLLQSNFGYSVIDINVQDFLTLNYSDRVEKLKFEINTVRGLIGKITQQ